MKQTFVVVGFVVVIAKDDDDDDDIARFLALLGAQEISSRFLIKLVLVNDFGSKEEVCCCCCNNSWGLKSISIKQPVAVETSVVCKDDDDNDKDGDNGKNANWEFSEILQILCFKIE